MMLGKALGKRVPHESGALGAQAFRARGDGGRRRGRRAGAAPAGGGGPLRSRKQGPHCKEQLGDAAARLCSGLA